MPQTTASHHRRAVSPAAPPLVTTYNLITSSFLSSYMWIRVHSQQKKRNKRREKEIYWTTHKTSKAGVLLNAPSAMYVILLLLRCNFCNLDRCSNVSFPIASSLLCDKSLKSEIQNYKIHVTCTSVCYRTNVGFRIQVFWDVRLCCWFSGSRRFEGNECRQTQWLKI